MTKEEERALVEKVHREAVERLVKEGWRGFEPRKRPTIPYTELTASDPNEVLGPEWNFYLREVGRLLAEGHEGKSVLIKGEQLVGLYDTFDAAYRAGVEAYLLQPFLVHQILAEEPLLRVSQWCLPCRS